MAKILGRQYSVGIGREGVGVRGAPVEPQFWIPLSEAPGIENKVTLIQDEQGYGVLEDSVDIKTGNKWAEGSIIGRLRIKSIGLLLLNIFGTSTPQADTPVAGKTTHTFTVQESNQHPSFTIGIDDPQAGDIGHALGMLEMLEIKAEIGEPIVFTANIQAKKSQSLTVSPGFPTTPELIFTAKDMTAYFAATATALATANPTNIRSATIRFITPLEKDFVLGQEDPNDINNLTFGMEIEITKSYVDTTYKDYFLTAGGRALRLVIANVAQEKLQFDLNQIKLTDWSKSTDLNNLLVETLTFRANYKLADAKMVQAVLVNTQASYTAAGAGGGLAAKAEIA